MEKDQANETSHLEHAYQGEKIDDVAHDAALAEHQQSLWQALKAEPKAVFWSVAVSSAVIMEGYDIVLVTSLFAQPAFAERYGSFSAESGWQITASWQSALGLAPMLGAILGAFLNGYLALKLGYRKVLLVSLVAMTAFIFLLFFATSLGMLLAGLILCGVPWGVFATMAPAYASEACSLRLRGYLTIYVNLCWAFGQLLAAGVLQAFAEGTDERAYRIPFAIQWIFPLPIFAIIWFCPESPWWLVRKGRMDEARQAIRNLTSKNSPATADETIALIQHTIRIEEESETGTSYLDCFKGVDLRRTEIICMTFAAQVWCGSPLGGAPVYFFVNAGLSPSNAFKFNVGGLGLASIGTIASWALLSRFGRRTLYVYGLGLLAATLLTTGAVAAGAGTGSTSSYIQAAFVVLWLLCYYLTVGPVCYAIISEMSAVRLRNKSVCISRIAYYLSQIVGNVIQPYMINPNAGNWQGKTAFFWAGTCLVFFLWAFFRLPESKDRSYEQLDILFNEHVGARQFAKMNVDAYAPRGERVKVA